MAGGAATKQRGNRENNRLVVSKFKEGASGWGTWKFYQKDSSSEFLRCITKIP